MKKSTLGTYMNKLSPVKKLKIPDIDKPRKSYDKITSRIYIGDIHAAKDKKFFKDKNIKAVLNCTKDIPNYMACSTIEYMRIPVDDSLKEIDINKMHKFMPVAADFIHKHTVLQKNNILVHCAAGRERSCSCVVAYLMKYCKKTPQTACKHVLDKRPEAFFYGQSINFEKSINNYYKDLVANRG